MTPDARGSAWSRTVRRHLPRAAVRGAYGLLDGLGRRYRPPDERDTCPACESPDIALLHPLPLHDRPHSHRVGFATGCRRCGVVFANPLPSEDTLARQYSASGRYGRVWHTHRNEAAPSGRYLFRLLEPIAMDLDVAHPPPGSAALDFGCGSGELLDVLRDRGWETYGIEPGQKTAFDRHTELQAIPASPTFRLAVAHHVLEHVSNPLPVLRALHGSLVPGGFVLVSVPRLDTLPLHGDYRYCINDRTHILSYTSDAMATLLGLAGFEAIDLNPPPEESHDRRTLRRMRMLGRKGAAPVLVPHPLDAAVQAFETWAAAGGPLPFDRTSRLSVRAQAAVLNFERARPS